MSKRDFTLVAFGAVAAALGAVAALLAYGVFVSPSAEVPEAVEVPEERTVAEIEEQIAAVEADIEYLKTEVNAARMRGTGELSVPAYLWNELEVCWEVGTVSGRCYSDTFQFFSYCTNEPQCRAAIETLMAKRDELGELEDTKFDLELQQAELELDQKMRER